MNTLFSSCLGDAQTQYDKLSTVLPQPIKFRIANSINLFDLILKYFAQPRKTEKYIFSRNNLSYLISEKSHVPFIYFPSAFPQVSLIIVYCHGSGSTLNNVYDFAYTMAVKYGVAFLAYDYSGDGQSEKTFNSYEDDIKLVLAHTVKLGYKLNRTILCGFSLGSYSALCLEGQMPRILISPICGVISFFQTQGARYFGQKYDNVQKAMKLDCKSLIFHCSQQLVHLSHGKLIHNALKSNSKQQSVFYEITDKLYQHRSAPSFLCCLQGQKVMISFLTKISKQTRKMDIKNPKTFELLQQLQKLSYITQNQYGQQTKNDLSDI